jgi:isoleucyl-tRNA synthetase
MSEGIYQNMVRKVDKKAPISVHLCDFPSADTKLIDEELEKNMELVLKIVVAGRSCRNTANIKNRQPIGNMYVKADFELPEIYKGVVQDELNVKKIIFTDDTKEFITYKFKPQMKTLGPKYGKLLSKIGEKLTTVDGNDFMGKLKEHGTVGFELEGIDVSLTEEDLLIEVTQKDGFVAEVNKDVTVVLDTNLTPELIEEGFVREIVSKVQTMRKEAGFEVSNHIKFYYGDNDKISSIIEKYKGKISNELLADEMIKGSADGYTKEWNINNEKVIMTVVKV